MSGLCLVCKRATSCLGGGASPLKGLHFPLNLLPLSLPDAGSSRLRTDQRFSCMSNGLSRCGRELHQFPGHTPQNQIWKTQLGWDLALCTSVNPNRCVVCIQLSHPNTPYTLKWMQIPVGDMKRMNTQSYFIDPQTQQLLQIYS